MAAAVFTIGASVKVLVALAPLLRFIVAGENPQLKPAGSSPLAFPPQERETVLGRLLAGTTVMTSLTGWAAEMRRGGEGTFKLKSGIFTVTNEVASFGW